MMNRIGLIADAVSVTINGSDILVDVTVAAGAGEILALVGPNGAGKSTLLGVLSGEIQPRSGSVTLDQREVSRMSHRELARVRSVLSQDNAVSFSFLAGQVIEMGRAPWARASDSQEDAVAIERAVERTETGRLLDRSFSSLSGGEKARVSLARVLAQDTSVVLLDEPTAALDLRHQEAVLRLARELADEGRTVVIVIHDLSLAAAYSDRVALLAGGRLVSAGEPWEVLTAPRIREIYHIEVEVAERDNRPLILPIRGR